jgi:hypothetical protein
MDAKSKSDAETSQVASNNDLSLVKAKDGNKVEKQKDNENIQNNNDDDDKKTKEIESKNLCDKNELDAKLKSDA